jgi:uncharacterized lipoprotein NlpE involved in copper resistance
MEEDRMNRMKRTMPVYLAIARMFGLGACQSTADAANSARYMLEWEGVYTGVIPAADAPGINVEISLNADETFRVVYQYLDKKDATYKFSGSFAWDKTGSIVALHSSAIPPYYRVGEGTLTQLDIKGKPITGKLANNYVLIKKQDALPLE